MPDVLTLLMGIHNPTHTSLGKLNEKSLFFLALVQYISVIGELANEPLTAPFPLETII